MSIHHKKPQHDKKPQQALKGHPLRWNKKWRRTMMLLSSIIVLPGLSGCQHLSTDTASQQSASTQTPTPAAPALYSFRLKGKVSLRQNTRQPQRNTRASAFYTAEIHWEQAGDRYGIDLSAPLNQGHLKIVGDHTFATIWDSHANAHQSEHPEQLLLQLTGVSFPIIELQQWISGQPDLSDIPPEHITWQHDENEKPRIRSFQKKGWLVHYRAWTQQQDHWLPKTIELQDETRRLKMFIYDWDQLSYATPH